MKYTPAQKAKSTAALLSALALFLTVTAGYVTDLLPTGNGAAVAIAGAITVVGGILVRTATYLTTSAPTLEQIQQNADAVIELIQKVKPEVLAADYKPGRHARDESA